MQKVLIVFSLVITLCACGGSKSNNSTNKQANTPDRFIELRETAKKDLEENSAVAVSVAIYQGGEIVFAEAFGEKEKDSGEAATPDTLFQAGSTTKIFTSIATMQLVENGLLTTEDKLVDVLPDMALPDVQAEDWEGINIHHLLSHQSGLPDTYFGDDADASLRGFLTETYPLSNRQMNPPGAFFNYSNPNWSYLGAVIEELGGQSYSDYMKQNVFDALGMNRTSIGRDGAVSDGDYALGFQRLNDTEEFLDDINQIPLSPFGAPAGSETWSTPSELLKVAPLLLSGNADVLADEQRIRITTPQVHQEFAGLPWYYGYGLFIEEGFMHREEWYPERLWAHNGNTNAYTSMFWVLPDRDLAISIMSSGAHTDFIETMLAAINSVASLPELEEVPAASVNSDEFEKHVGIYDAELFIVEVTLVDGQLEINVPEMNAQNIPYNPVLTAIGDTTFIAELDDEEVTFTFLPAVEGGESVYLRNRNYVGIKVDDAGF